jgi:hypothetical protein
VKGVMLMTQTLVVDGSAIEAGGAGAEATSVISCIASVDRSYVTKDRCHSQQLLARSNEC